MTGRTAWECPIAGERELEQDKGDLEQRMGFLNMYKNSSAARLFLGLILIIIPVKAFPGVIDGTGVLTYGEWDFSDSAAVHCMCGDIYVIDVFEPPLGLVVTINYPPSAILSKSGAAVFDTLKYAPEDTSLYHDWVPATMQATYVVITREGHYAKFRFTSLSAFQVIIEYVYQPDGSSRLFDPIAVKSTSWGRIKSLYQ